MVEFDVLLSDVGEEVAEKVADGLACVEEASVEDDDELPEGDGMATHV